MNTEPILSFRQDAGFYARQAEQCREAGDTPGLLRYLRLAAGAGDTDAEMTLAEEYSLLHCCQASDRVLEGLMQKNALPPEGYYLLGVNAAAQGRYVTACAALERFLLFSLDVPATDQAEQLLSALDARYYPQDRHAATRSYLRDAWAEAFMKNDLTRMKRFRGPVFSALTEATELIGQGKGTEALEKLVPLAENEKEPGFALHLLLFRASCLTHEPVMATAAMLAALPLCGSVSDSLLLCLACEENRRERDALGFAEAWLRHFPDDAVFLLLASRLCEKIPGLKDKAAEYRLRAARIDPEAVCEAVTDAEARIRTRLLLLRHHRGSTAEKRLLHTCCFITRGRRGEALERSMDRSLGRMTRGMKRRLESENSTWRTAVTLQTLHTSGLPDFPPLSGTNAPLSRSVWRKMRHLSRVPQAKNTGKGTERYEVHQL